MRTLRVSPVSPTAIVPSVMYVPCSVDVALAAAENAICAELVVLAVASTISLAAIHDLPRSAPIKSSARARRGAANVPRAFLNMMFGAVVLPTNTSVLMLVSVSLLRLKRAAGVVAWLVYAELSLMPRNPLAPSIMRSWRDVLPTGVVPKII